MYFVALVAARLLLKWFYSNVQDLLSPVRAFRDERMALLALDESLKSSVLNRCADMQKTLLSGHSYASFFAEDHPVTVESCGEASRQYLNYVDMAIAAVIGVQVLGLVVSAIKYQFCEQRDAYEDAFPSPPTPPESPPPTDRALKEKTAGNDAVATKTADVAETLRKRKTPVVYSDNMDV